MRSNNVVLIVNVTIILTIGACTLFGIANDVEGWGYSYLLLMCTMSSSNEGDENAK